MALLLFVKRQKLISRLKKPSAEKLGSKEIRMFFVLSMVDGVIAIRKTLDRFRDLSLRLQRVNNFAF